MIENDFSELSQRKIINIMIDGEFLPYQTANNLRDLVTKFGFTTKFDSNGMSRWQIMKALLIELNKTDKTNDFLKYILSPIFLKSKIEQLKQTDLLALEPFEIEEKNIIIEQSRDEIQENFLAELNNELIFSHKKITVHNNIFSITNNLVELDNLVIKDRVDSGYISSLLENAKNDIHNEDFDSVITKARTILEEVFLQVISENNEEIKSNGKIIEYRNKVHEILGMKKNDDWDGKVVKLIGSLNNIVTTIAELRNINSDSHGSANRKKINEAEAELVINSAVMLGNYYLKVNDRHK